MDTQQSTFGAFLVIVRIIGAIAVLVIATIAALVVLDVVPETLLAELTMKAVLVAAIAAAAVGLVTVLLSGRRG